MSFVLNCNTNGLWFQDHLALMMELLGMMPRKVNPKTQCSLIYQYQE